MGGVKVDSLRLTGWAEQRATRLVFLFCGIVAAAWAPLVPYAKVRVHANDQQFGLLLLCFGLGSIVAMPLMGRLAGQYGCKRLIQLAQAGAALAFASLAIASRPMTLAASLFAFGASIGSLDVVMNVQALIVDKVNDRELMPTFHAFFSLGGISGAVLMGALLWANLRPATAAATIIGLCIVLAYMARMGLLSHGNASEAEEKRGFTWPRESVLILGLLTLLAMLAEGSMLDWSGIYLVDRAHVAAKHAGLGFAVFSITMTVSRLVGSKALAAFGRAPIVTTGAFLTATGFTLAAISPAAPVAVTGFALVGLGLGNIVPLFFTLASESKGSLGMNVSFVTSLGYTGVLCGPALIGFIVHASSFEVAFAFVAAMLTVVALASLPLTRQTPRST